MLGFGWSTANSVLIQIHKYISCVCLIQKARNSFSTHARAGIGNPELHNSASACISDSFSPAHICTLIPAHLASSLIQEIEHLALWIRFF